MKRHKNKKSLSAVCVISCFILHSVLNRVYIIIIIITPLRHLINEQYDSDDADAVMRLQEEATMLKSITSGGLATKVIVLGVGNNVELCDLRNMASSPPDRNIILVPDFTSLTSITEQLGNETYSGKHLSFDKACRHLFPKQDTLYPETGDFVAENGNKVAFSGHKVSYFGNKCGQAFKLSVCESLSVIGTRIFKSVFLR